MTDVKPPNVFGFGWNEDHRTALGTDDGCTLLPTSVKALEGVTIYRVAAGYRHSLLLANSGAVYSVGEGAYGALGHGDRANKEAPSAVECHAPNATPDLSPPVAQFFVTVACGMHSSFAVTGTGQLYSWGRGRFGVLGHGDEADELAPRAVDEVNDVTRVKELSIGDRHAMMLSAQGNLYCWGCNTHGQLGFGTKRHAFLPTVLRDLSPELDTTIVSFSAGAEHSLCACDMLDGGGENERQVYSWGNGAAGRLGHANDYKSVNETSYARPRKIRFLKKQGVSQVAAGGAHSIALVGADGEHARKLFVWGEGGDGQLGNDWCSRVYKPWLIKHSKFAFAQVFAGQRHTLALTSRSQLVGWGYGGWGATGFGDDDIRFQPHQIMSFENKVIECVATKYRHSFVAISAKQVFVRDDPRYERHMRKLRNDPMDREKIEVMMADEGLNPEFLDTPDAVLTKPVPETLKQVEPEEPELRYCYYELAHEALNSYEIVYECPVHKMKRLCRACSRHCHGRCPLIARMVHEVERCHCSDPLRPANRVACACLKPDPLVEALDEEQIATARRAFKKYDKERDGKILQKDLQKALAAAEVYLEDKEIKHELDPELKSPPWCLEGYCLWHEFLHIYAVWIQPDKMEETKASRSKHAREDRLPPIRVAGEMLQLGRAPGKVPVPPRPPPGWGGGAGAAAGGGGGGEFAAAALVPLRAGAGAAGGGGTARVGALGVSGVGGSFFEPPAALTFNDGHAPIIKSVVGRSKVGDGVPVFPVPLERRD